MRKEFWNYGLTRIMSLRGLILAMVGVMMAFPVFAADPSVSVTAQQRYPWNGMVDVAFTITGDSGTKYDTSFVARDVAGGTNLTMKTIYKSDGSAAALTNQLAAGSYKWVWNAAADLPNGFNCERVTVDVNASDCVPYYVKFNANGGTGTMANELLYVGVDQSLTANSFTKSGYDFFGWSTSTSAVRAYTNCQAVTSLSSQANAVVNLYAIWTVSKLGVGINCETLPWTTDATNPWYYLTSETINGTTYYPYDKKHAVKSSGAGGGSADSWIQTTIKGPATVKVRYAKRHYSSTFTVLRDSTTLFTDSEGTDNSAGVVGWYLKTFSIPTGVHTLRFNYHHPGIGFAAGGNGIRLDDFSVTY